MSGYGASDAVVTAQAGPVGTAPAGGLLDQVERGLAERWSADADELDAMCAHALVPAGKMFRPILLLESARAVGGDMEVVLPAAVGAESGHVASLVHDDIIDGDELRRGRPSVQHKFGVDSAIVAGDALIFDLFVGLAECRATGAAPDRIVAALEVVARCGIDLCRGQSMEAELCRRADFDLDGYLTMIKLKTAAFFRAACECGALLAGGDESLVRALGRYAENLGVAFQIHDDLLACTGRTADLGKPEVSDIRNRRLTLPVILAHRAGTEEQRREIRGLLDGDGDPGRRRDALVAFLHGSGAILASRRYARQYVDLAVETLWVLPASPSRDRLRGFARAVVDRDR